MGTLNIPRILLPNVSDMSAWAVIACDQFTSDGEYWRNLKSFVGNKPSTLNLIYPEIFLNYDTESRIRCINENMYAYLNGGLFRSEDTIVLVERTTQSGTRTGLVLSVDLEDYSFRKGSSALIRSTEATIEERIPPRVRIRENAPIELPHIMLLYDDPSAAVLSHVKRGEVLYDFDLKMGGGHVKGTHVFNSQEVRQAFYSLSGCRGDDKMLFAVGDGNHSLAAAKMCWENVKANLSPEQAENHPARYALCEAVNIYDGALLFHPIHRFIRTNEPQKFLSGWRISGGGTAVAVINGVTRVVPFPENVPEGIRLLDEYIADFIGKNGGEVDYIHGDSDLISLTAEGIGIMLPSIKKEQFFPLILSGGNLPQKTFSMGEGNEKRYYIEAKRIK